MPAALAFALLLAAAPPAEARPLRPGLWRLTLEPLYMPPLKENIAARIVETVCVGDTKGLSPLTLKPDKDPMFTAYLYKLLKGDPARAYTIWYGGGPHSSPGYYARAKRLGDCRKGWLPGARRVEESKLFQPPTAEEIEAMMQRARAKAR